MGQRELLWDARAANPKRAIPVEPVFYEAPPRRTTAPPTPPTAPPPPRAFEGMPVEIRQAFPRDEPSSRFDWRTFRWQTWHLVALCGLGAVIGMAIGNASRPAAKASTGSAAPAAHAKSRRTASTAPSTRQPGAGVPPTTASPTTVTTTATPPATVASPNILLDIKRQTGPMTTQHFTTSAPRWTLGWAYDCSGQGGSGSFKVTIFNADGTPSPDGGVDQQGAKGSSVAAYGSSGERYLTVQTPCVWAVKVTS